MHAIAIERSRRKRLQPRTEQLPRSQLLAACGNASDVRVQVGKCNRRAGGGDATTAVGAGESTASGVDLSHRLLLRASRRQLASGLDPNTARRFLPDPQTGA